LPQLTAASSLSARCVSSRRFARLLPLPPLPSGTFASLGIEAFNRFRCFAAHLPDSPDFLSLPAAGSISRVGCGSTFLARYVSEGLLFLKPLGTSFTMPLSSFPVNRFQAPCTPFPQHLSGMFLIGYVEAPANRLWIKHAIGVVLLCPFCPQPR